jgi:hypothetical protein
MAFVIPIATMVSLVNWEQGNKPFPNSTPNDFLYEMGELTMDMWRAWSDPLLKACMADGNCDLCQVRGILVFFRYAILA